MNARLVEMIGGIAPHPREDEARWRPVAAALAEAFRSFIGGGDGMGWDAEPHVHQMYSGFSLWLWSQPANSPLSVSWTCVMGGGFIDEESPFSASATLFLFHASTRTRLVTADGRGLLEFTFDCQTGDWRSVGWEEDGWGEWEDVST